jgi:hypothetical protein
MRAASSSEFGEQPRKALPNGTNPTQRIIERRLFYADAVRLRRLCALQKHLSSPSDREALFVQQLTHPEKTGHILLAVQPLTAGGAMRTKLELRLPIPKHVRFYADELRDLTDTEIKLVWHVCHRAAY